MRPTTAGPAELVLMASVARAYYVEGKAKTDTYADVRESLKMLAGARRETGLNRELLTRSLLHEALYQVRFGEDTASASRSAAIRRRDPRLHPR